MAEALTALAVGDRIDSVDVLVADGRVAAEQAALVERWIDLLAQDGLVTRHADHAVVGDDLPSSAAVLASGGAVMDGIEPLLAYVQRCGERLAAIVTGDESPLATLFPDGNYDTVDFLYHHWAAARYFNGVVRASVAAVAGEIDGPVDILEVGAGTGGTAAAILPALNPDRSSYTFTDVSDFFLVRARERFAPYSFVRYGILDLESPDPEEYAPGSYDIVIAANVLHATPDLDATLSHILDLLAPGGVLVAYEATHHPRWFDVSTGLIEGWQLFEDDWRGDHPLLEAPRWREALAAAGYDQALTLPADGASAEVLGQHIVIGRKPGAVGTKRRGSAPTAAESEAVSGLALPNAAALREQLDGAMGRERDDIMIDFVRVAVAHVLRIGEPDRLQRDQPLLDLGFDSLMAVEFRNVLREGLQLDRKLAATMIFDHPTIGAVARHLSSLLEGGAQGSEAPAPAATAEAVPATDVSAMSDDEVEAMLLAKLEGAGDD